MKWAGLLAALVGAMVIQTTLSRLGDLPLVDLDWLLVLALIYGLVAPAADARLAAWIIGFAADLCTEGPVGLYAFAFGLAGFLLTRLRELVNRRVWWARWLAAFLAAWPGQFLILLHLRYFQGALLDHAVAGLPASAGVALTAGLLAALATGIPLLAQRRTRSPATYRSL